jgi:transcriptional regulator NrdR family protein
MNCPRCGCTDSYEIEAITIYGKATSRRECRYCGYRWLVGVTIYAKTACPRCGSTRTKVTSSAAPVRYHRCDMCFHPFKSVDHHAGDPTVAEIPAKMVIPATPQRRGRGRPRLT